MQKMNHLVNENPERGAIDESLGQRYNPSQSDEEKRRREFLEIVCEMLVNYKNLEGLGFILMEGSRASRLRAGLNFRGCCRMWKKSRKSIT